MIAALQAIGLIPREPATIPLEDRLLESVNADEMRELLRRERVSSLQYAHAVAMLRFLGR